MKMRLNHYTANPEVYRAMSQLERHVRESGLDRIVYELIKIRASQINGCSFCLDMHTNELRKLGETEQRIALVSVWRESPCYTDKEKAVLELTEAVTLISKGGVSEELFNRILTFYSEKETVDLIFAINLINSWNRIAITTGMFPGCLDNA
ncbi:carboxymuconolactone decarboxylase family protein [Paenibacillus sp. Marseille-P2973]|uniref:carboxymuconolactone decarboxylase family protein n=1 Tax=Paenibacillus sp. Marseille-P2973 TaxID=1871032 RepID=UPI000FB76121|nr:carboxymuconolactone decarboxylase family protein [Paenibacillus sp. Marseille-P2973]MBQ4898860.1 carboxymuconolactone decarboxylase family protein [Paenibacillus sp. Marseille-P2973]